MDKVKAFMEDIGILGRHPESLKDARHRAIPGFREEPSPAAPAPAAAQLESSAVKEVKLTLLTGNWGGEGATACYPVISFCPEIGKCTLTPYQTVEPSHFGASQSSEFTVFSADGRNNIFEITSPSDLDYFTIEMAGDCNDPWLLQSVKLESKIEERYADGAKKEKKKIYWNSSVIAWLNNGSRLSFGPKDTAVYAAVSTCSSAQGGTNDDIYLVFDTRNALKNQQSEVNAEFGGRLSGGGNSDITMLLDWPPIDDFEQGRRDGYGIYTFDYDPFWIVWAHPYGGESEALKPADFHIEKSPDGENGSWCMERLKVIAYHPASSFKYDNAGNIVINPDDPPYMVNDTTSHWLSNDSGLRQPVQGSYGFNKVRLMDEIRGE
jgi:hypothetical protein